MKKCDVKSGMKVVPHSKSRGFCDLDNSIFWNNVKNSKNPYLYVIKVHDMYKNCFILSDEEYDDSGDFFKSSDFEPYVEPESIPKPIKSPEEILSLLTEIPIYRFIDDVGEYISKSAAIEAMNIYAEQFKK